MPCLVVVVPMANKALVNAVRCCNAPALRALLAAGASPNLVHEGETLLHLAIYSDKRDDGACCAALLAAGASANAPSGHMDTTPLLEAAMYGRAHCASVLLAAGADGSAESLIGAKERTPTRLTFVAWVQQVEAATRRWRGLRRTWVSVWCRGAVPR